MFKFLYDRTGAISTVIILNDVKPNIYTNFALIESTNYLSNKHTLESYDMNTDDMHGQTRTSYGTKQALDPP